MKKIILLYFILSSCYSFAQVDYNYIGLYDQKIAVKAFTSKKFLALINEYDKDYSKTYMPNNPIDIGLGIAINGSALSFSYGYGFDFMRERSKGKTSSLDFQFHKYARKYAFDIFFQRYKGFYMEDDKFKNQYTLCPDLSIKKYGISGEYLFNGKKFSYKAAFDQSKRQLRSVGSIIAGVGIHYTDIKSDTSFIFNNKNRIQNYLFSLSGGYAYTWVLGRYYCITGATTVGIGFGNRITKNEKDEFGVFPVVFPRVSAGYDRKKWSLGFSFLGNITFQNMADNSSLSLLSVNLQLTYTRRFDFYNTMFK